MTVAPVPEPEEPETPAPRKLTDRAVAGARVAGARVLQFTEAAVEKFGGPAPSTSSDDGRAEIRRGFAAMFVFFVLFLGWAAFAPLDAAVVAQGYVTVSGSRQTLGHRDGGVVSRIAVIEGQKVREGDILVELAEGETLGQEQSLFAQVTQLQIRRARLVAEATGATEMTKPPEWASLSNEERAAADTMWTASAAEAGVHGQGGRPWSEFDARIAGYNEEINGLNQQEASLEDELRGMRELAADNLVPLTRVRALERSIADVRGRRGELRAGIAGARENRDSDLREVDAHLAELMPQLGAARDRLERTRMRAPTSGSVVGLAVHNVGSIVRPGDRVLDIVPDGQELVVEARLRPEDADDLVPGMKVEVKITAFSGRDLPLLDGRVRTVSADRFNDERTGQGYFLTTVSVSASELRALANSGDQRRQLRAGLPAQIVAPTRRRTMLQYLIEPLNQALWRSFREH